jgi:hypothetical protein
MESMQLVLIGNTYIDSVTILASAKNSQFTSRKMHSTQVYTSSFEFSKLN